MATTIRASSSNSATTGTAISVVAPTGTTTGDLVTISVHVNTDTTIVDNNGATPFTEDLTDYSPNPSSGMTVSLFSRRIQIGDPTTFNFTSGGTGRWSITAVTYQDPNLTTIYDVAPSTTNAARQDPNLGTTEVAPTITTLTDNAIHVVCGYLDDGASAAISGPAGYTQRAAPVNQPQVLSTKVITSAGATGPQTVTFPGTANTGTIALSYAIKDVGVASSRPFMSTQGAGT